MRGVLLTAVLAATTGAGALPAPPPARVQVQPRVLADVRVRADAHAFIGARSREPAAVVSTGGGRLNSRTGPSVIHRVVGALPNGSRVAVACQVYGQAITGPRGRSANWDLLTGGQYVADAYLRWRPARPALPWCSQGRPVTATVASSGGPVNVRSGPSTQHRLVLQLAHGSVLRVRCLSWGERISGPRGDTNRWNRLARGRYISDALVAWRRSRPALPWCGQAPPTVPPGTSTGFIDRVAPGARSSMRRYAVPASVTIAQAILESGWGRSRLARRDHNYFGIKCFGEPGPIAVGCRTYATTECGGGRCWRTRASFRAYRDAADSMADHGRFLAVNERYSRAFRYTRSPNRFAAAIHRAGYATSPTYARKLIGIMRRYKLYRFDT